MSDDLEDLLADEDFTPVKPAKKVAKKAAPAPVSGDSGGKKSEASVEAETEARVRAEMESKHAEDMAALRAELTAAQQPQVADMASLIAAEVQKAVAAAGVAAEPPVDPQVAHLTSANPKQISAEDVDGDPTIADSVTIHFVEDGFTALGRVWYRGEELTLTPGSKEWESSLLRDGTNRVFAHLDEYEQEEKYGERKFRSGPWRGRTFDLADPDLTDEERARLRAAAEKRAQRTGVPAPN